MPKLPDNYVKAPVFDDPLRSTASKHALTERKLTLRLDALTWEALRAASEREGCTPEALVQRALERFLTQPGPAAVAAQDVDLDNVTLSAQLISRLRGRLTRLRWVQRLLTLREIGNPSRA